MLYSFFNTLIKGYLRYRRHRIQMMHEQPMRLQQEVHTALIDSLRQTEYGKSYGISQKLSIQDYKKAMPIIEYEAIAGHVEKMMDGAESILWPGKVQWFAKSSGTTNNRSKYIPITDENLFDNHVAASWDAMTILYGNRPDAQIFYAKNLIMGGSLSQYSPNVHVGDVSAILLHRMPSVGRPFYTPDFETALLADWEQKIEKIAQQCKDEEVVMFAGVPTWTIVLFNRILEITGKSNMSEVWPNAKTYLHGGVGFDPYIDQFKQFFPKDDMEYYEVYNASEGYFAVQDRLGEKGMLLLLDNAIYYEFLPLENLDDPAAETLTLEQVELNKDYCIIISTSAGLWRYKPGDTVRFVSLSPYRVMVSGRTKHFINVFGEEVMVHNTDKAIAESSAIMNAVVRDYTVAPAFMDGKSKGYHEWLIEFDKAPADVASFATILDQRLRENNSDYDAKRSKDLALENLKINPLPSGSFEKWLISKKRRGAQAKIPRLSNKRDFLEEILDFVRSDHS